MLSKLEENRRLEGRERRALRRVGLLVRKSRRLAHVPNRDNLGEFMPIDGERGPVVSGSRFAMSAVELLEFCTRPEQASNGRVGT